MSNNWTDDLWQTVTEMDIKDNNTNIWLKIIKIVMCFEIVFWKKEEKISVFNQGP